MGAVTLFKVITAIDATLGRGQLREMAATFETTSDLVPDLRWAACTLRAIAELPHPVERRIPAARRLLHSETMRQALSELDPELMEKYFLTSLDHVDAQAAGLGAIMVSCARGCFEWQDPDRIQLAVESLVTAGGLIDFALAIDRVIAPKRKVEEGPAKRFFASHHLRQREHDFRTVRQTSDADIATLTSGFLWKHFHLDGKDGNNPTTSIFWDPVSRRKAQFGLGSCIHATMAYCHFHWLVGEPTSVLITPNHVVPFDPKRERVHDFINSFDHFSRKDHWREAGEIGPEESTHPPMVLVALYLTNLHYFLTVTKTKLNISTDKLLEVAGHIYPQSRYVNFTSIENQKAQERLAVYDKLLQRNPRDGFVMVRKGVALIELGQIEQGFATQRRGLEILEENRRRSKRALGYSLSPFSHPLILANDWFEIGKAVYQHEKRAEAVLAFQEAIRLNPQLAHPMGQWASHMSGP